MIAKSFRTMEFVVVVGLLYAPMHAAETKTKSTDLPQAVSDTLNTRFPDLKIVSAEKETEGGQQIYDVELTQKGRKFETDIREDGTMLEVEKQITEKHWPKTLVAAVKAASPNSTIEEVMKIFKVNGKTEMPHHFEVTVKIGDNKSAELLFTLDGRPMKEESAGTSTKAASEETTKGDELPAKVKEAIHAKFPKATIDSSEKGKEEGQEIYEVSIKEEKHKFDVTLTTDGKILGFEKSISKAEQPKAMSETLKSKYQDATIKLTEEVWEHDKLMGYEVTLVTKDKKTLEIMFDPKGKLVSDKKED